MKNRNLIQRLGDFMLGKGFYIVLFLCVATIGISGYYLLNSIAGDMDGTSRAPLPRRSHQSRMTSPPAIRNR